MPSIQTSSIKGSGEHELGTNREVLNASEGAGETRLARTEEQSMRGAQGPGDARGEQAPTRAHPRAASRQVYTMRRLLAALILLALLVPLACQALLGSEDE